MKGKNLALILALSTSFLAQGPNLAYAEDAKPKAENIDKEEKTEYKKPENQKEAQENYDKAKDNLDKDKKVLADNQEKVDKDQTNLDNLEKKVKVEEENKAKAKETIEAKVEEEKKSKAQAKADAEKAENQAKEDNKKAEEAEDEAQKDLAKKEADEKSLAAQYETAKKENPDLDKNLAQGEKDLADAKKAEKEAEKAKAKANEDESQAQSEVDSLTKDKKEKEKSLEEKKQNLEAAELKEKNLKESLEKTTKDIDEAEKDPTYKANKEKLEANKTKLEELNKTIQEKTSEKDQLEKALEKLKADLKALEDAKDDKTINELKAQIESKEKEKLAKETEIKENSDKIAIINAEIKRYTESLETAKTHLEKSKKEFEENKEKAQTTREEKTKLENELKEKNKLLKELEYKTSKEYAQAQWDKGSIGFFEAMGSQDVNKVFTTVTKEKEGTTTAEIYLKENEIKDKLDPSDSRTLENMYKAIMDIGKINEKREEGGIGGRELTQLKVTDYYMAIAQANANYSHSFDRGHASMFDQFENLAWGGGGIEQAIEGWWDAEKQVFEDYIEKGYKNVDDISDHLKNNPQKVGNRTIRSVGHYLNFVDDAWFKKEGSANRYNNSIVGYAVRPGDYGFVKAMDMTEYSSDNSFTVEAYQKRFEKYYNNLKDIIDGKKSGASEEDLKKINDLKSEIKALKAKIEEKNTELAKIEEKNKVFEKGIPQLEEYIPATEKSIESSKRALQEFTAKENSLKSELETIKNDIKDLEEKVEKAKEAPNTSNEEVAKKKEELNNKISQTENDIKTKTNEISDATSKKTATKNENKTLETQIKDQEKKIEGLKTQKSTNEAKLEKATAEKEAKAQEKESLETEIQKLDAKIPQAMDKLKEAKATNEKAQKTLEEKQTAKNSAEEKLRKLQEDNKAYTDLKTKAEKAKKDLENAKESLKKAKEAKEKAAKNLEDAEIKLIKAVANNKLAQKLDANNLDSLLDNGISVGAISAFRAAEENINKLEEPIKEAKAKLDTSKKALAEAKEIYKKSLAKFNIAENDLKAFTKPVENKENEHPNEKDENQNLPTININDILTTKDEDEDKSEDPKVNKPSSLELLKLRQALLRNKTLIKAAELLLKIAPQRVADIKPQLLKIIKEAKELCKQAEKILATYNN